jgi:uncharacterized protein YqgC (DUF456 family)
MLTFMVLVFGLLGSALPAVPGPPLMWLALASYDVVVWLQRGLTVAEGTLLVVATLLAIAGTTADWWLSGLGARGAGAERRSSVLAVIAGFAALIVLPLTGVGVLLAAVVLPVLVVVLAEYGRHGEARRSVRAGCGYATGWVLATAVELGAGLSMLALWLWQVGRGGPL